MSVKVWLSVSLRGATNFIVVSSLRWVGGARWPSKGWRPLSCHHRDDSENDSDFVEKFLSRYLALPSVLSLVYGIFGFRNGPLLDQLVLRRRVKRHHDPVLSWHDPLVPDMRRNRDPPLCNWHRLVALEQVRTPIPF